MSNDIIQAKYDELDAISKRFVQQAESIQQMRSRIDRAMGNLQNGGWQGRGAQAFFSEMNVLTLPATTRLQAALIEAGQLTLQIIQIMQQAEQEAASVFKGGHGGSASNGAAGGNVSASPLSQDLATKNTGEIFNESYMEGLIGSRFQGENTAELNSLMEELFKAKRNDSPEVRRILDRMADIRGVDRESFHAQYQKYLQLYANGAPTGLPNIDLTKHGDFLGTTVSLRYGKVVGDAFGIDPIFGSLLNPTGGLVGPGDTSYQPSENDAIGYHGVVHDAAGYLKNFHGIGPGYDYLNRDILPTTSPLSGQVGGISWWMSHSELEVDVLPHLMPDIPLVPKFIEQRIGENLEGGIVSGLRIVSSVHEGGSDVIDGARDIFSGDFAKGGENIAKGAGTIIKGMGRSVIDIFD